VDPLRQPTHRRFTVADQADAGELRRVVSGYAERLDGTPDGIWRAGLVATELATNLQRHADPGGWVLARPVPPGTVELIAVDRGPGIADHGAAVDGHPPTPDGLGSGLAAVRRASSCFEVHTEPGRGTVVLALVEVNDRGAQPARRCCGGVSVGLEEPSGDGWSVTGLDAGSAVAVVDGLGHGQAASVAADAALEVFAAAPADLDGYLARANDAMRTTRGAAAAICRLDPGVGELHYVAVGNISARILTPTEERGLPSYNGTLGLHSAPPRSRVSSYPWPPGATLVLWTDGLRGRVDLGPAAELFGRDPALVAAGLLRDDGHDRDDATVVVLRHPLAS
jgi:anti-sigma regulatory factor (Ser/Thr protein kinase)